MNPLDPYNRALDELASSLSKVRADGWDVPTPCQLWTVRDIAGHVIWGQEQLRCWATGDEYAGPPGGPGTPHPAELAQPDALSRWQRARGASDAVLRTAPLEQPITVHALGEVPLATMVTVLTNDSLIHAWDIRHACGDGTPLPGDLVSASEEWARGNVRRLPGFFGPELAPPEGADQQERWLAFLGRAAWQTTTAV